MGEGIPPEGREGTETEGILNVDVNSDGQLVAAYYTDHNEGYEYDPDGNLVRVTRYESDGTRTVKDIEPDDDSLKCDLLKSEFMLF